MHALNGRRGTSTRLVAWVWLSLPLPYIYIYIAIPLRMCPQSEHIQGPTSFAVRTRPAPYRTIACYFPSLYFDSRHFLPPNHKPHRPVASHFHTFRCNRSVATQSVCGVGGGKKKNRSWYLNMLISWRAFTSLATWRMISEDLYLGARGWTMSKREFSGRFLFAYVFA